MGVCLCSKRLRGCLYRNFYLADTKCLNYLYKALVLPVLDYSSAVWNPHHKVHQQRLERVQGFAAKVVIKRWKEAPSLLVKNLGWATLGDRSLYQQLCLCSRILRGESLMPPMVFTPHPRPSRIHKNSQPLFKPRVRTHHHRNTFFVAVVERWNSLPDRVFSVSFHKAFKRWLRRHLEG